MDIKNVKPSDLLPSRVDRNATTGPQPASTRAPAAGGRTETGDQLTLTDSAQRLLEATRSAGDASPVDQARVDAIRSSIADGSYVIDPERIAAGLLKMEQDLGE